MNENIDKKLEQILLKQNIVPVCDVLRRKLEMEDIVRKIVFENQGRCFISLTTYDVNEILLKNGLTNAKYIIVDDIESVMRLQNDIDNNLYIVISYGDFSALKNKNRILYLYDMLKEYGYRVDHTYYEDSIFERDPYADISYYLERLDVNNPNEEILIKLIYKYFEIRDFANALIYIDIYIKKNLYQCEKVKCLKKDIRRFLQEIKKLINTKKETSIIMNWIDAVQYDEIEEFPFLKEMKERTLCFDNAYTVSPFTIPTYYTIFCKKRPVEDKLHLYKHDIINEENSKLLYRLKKEGYDFERKGVALNLFERENCSYVHKLYDELVEKTNETLDVDFNKLKKYKEMDAKEDICPMVMWEGVKTLLHGEKNFVLLHTVMETHTPYIAGNIKKGYVNDQYEPKDKQVVDAREYVNQQVEFYWNLWKENAITIFMSDHGKYTVGMNKKVYRDIFHTMLMIDGKNIPVKHYDRMFSYLDFDKLVDYIIRPDEKKLFELAREFVIVEDLDRYAISVLSQTNNSMLKSKVLGYRGVRTKKNTMFMIRNDGKEMYYRFPCIQNLYGEVDSSEEEKLYNRTFTEPIIDIWSDDYFKFSRIIYKAMRYHDNRVRNMQNRAGELLVQLLEENKNEVIALRGGGETANEILRIMGSKYNIKYVIDRSLTTEEGWPGITYFKEQDVGNYKDVSVVVIVSYDYREQMRCDLECNSLYRNIKIIDLYKYYEDNGLLLGEDFHADKIGYEDLHVVKNCYNCKELL